MDHPLPKHLANGWLAWLLIECVAGVVMVSVIALHLSLPATL
jgi:hypothetical protein